MKKYIHLIAIVAMFSIVVGTSGCRNDDPEMSETERVAELLASGTWKVQTVSVDGVDKTSMFPGLQLSFTSSGFTAANGGVVWPSSGTWQFTSDEATAIKRSDNVDVQIGEVTDTKLVLSLSWSSTTFGPGRVSSVSGEHTFTFNK